MPTVFYAPTLTPKKEGITMTNHPISGRTGFACLLGHPVSHSISPAMHNAAFAALDLNYVYLAFDVTENHLKDTVRGLAAMNCLGWNLTMPLKTAILPYLDELSAASRLSGSVNTVVNNHGRLIGHTTDGMGYMDSLRDAGHNIIGKNMVLLGAGGAATSICVQAALDGVKQIFLFKRKNATFRETMNFAEKISRETSCLVTVNDIQDASALKNAISESAILVNATNVGMAAQSYSLVPKEFLRSDLIVSDVIYHPKMTPLLEDAKRNGCPYLNGKYMLLFQGARSFYLWTGQKMPVTHIKKSIFTQEE